MNNQYTRHLCILSLLVFLIYGCDSPPPSKPISPEPETETEPPSPPLSTSVSATSPTSQTPPPPPELTPPLDLIPATSQISTKTPPPASPLPTSLLDPPPVITPSSIPESSPPPRPPTKPKTLSVHYSEIDEHKLRRTNTAHLFGEETPFTGRAFKTHPDGTRSFEIDYVDGAAEGILTQYYPNGNPSFQVPMRNNQANGMSTGWYQDHTRKSQYPYKNGVVHGVIKEWFPTGQLGFESTYNNGKLTGTLKGWYVDGTPYIVGIVKSKGAQRFTTYFAPSKKWRETGWREGKLWGYSYEWDQEGSILSVKRFQNGKLLKVIK